MTTEKDISNIEKGYEFLLGEYQALSGRLTLEVIIFRVISFIWLMILLIGLSNGVMQLISLAVAALFTAILWKSTVSGSARARQRLEHALVDFVLSDEKGELEKIYVEWRYERWKHPQFRQFLANEPFLWSVLTIGAIVLKLLAS